MRQQFLRTARRSQRLAHQTNAARTFSSSVRRQAEVELTVDGKKVSIEGMLVQTCHWYGLMDQALTTAQPAPPSSKPAKRPAAPCPATATTRN